MKKKGDHFFLGCAYARLFAIFCLLCGAAIHLSHEDYSFLRTVVCLVAFANAFCAKKCSCSWWAVALAAVGILYNPIARIHLTRPIWIGVDLAVVALFAATWSGLKEPSASA